MAATQPWLLEEMCMEHPQPDDKNGSLGFPVATKLLKKEMKFVFHLLPTVQISER